MVSGKIIVSREDYSRLVELSRDRLLGMIADRQTVRDLVDELRRAEIVEVGDVPADVVTMNSFIELTDLDCGERESYTLVYPKDANIVHGRLSILAPIGTAILGYRVGDEISWRVPAGTTRLRIDNVVHPPQAERDPVLLRNRTANRPSLAVPAGVAHAAGDR